MFTTRDDPESPGRLFALLGGSVKKRTPPTTYSLRHCLQTATGRCGIRKDDEYVAIALLHDAGERRGPSTTAR